MENWKLYCYTVAVQRVVTIVSLMWSLFDRWCKQDQILKTKTETKTTGSKQMHLADLTFR